LVYAGKVAYEYKGRMPSNTSITIKDGTLGITANAFGGCYSLTSITIPDSVTSIGGYAFYGCSSLTSIAIPEGVTSIGECAFEGCRNLTSITIPDSVTYIGYYAFSECRSLTSITIPNSVTSIGDSAFSGCSRLTSITIPSSVTSIGNSAFSGCRSLTSITIPDSVTSIGSNAFFDCSNLTSITVDENNTKYLSQSGVLFDNNMTTLICCPGGKTGTYTIPNSVTSIGSNAFFDCSNLTSITIPNSVTSIGDGTFYGCSSLKDVYLQKGANIRVGSGNDYYNSATKHEYVAVSYIADDAENVPKTDKILDLSTDIVLSNEIPQKEGYTFKGWSLSPDADNVDYTAGENIGTISDNLTLYAVMVHHWNTNIVSSVEKVNVGNSFTTQIQTFLENNYIALVSEIKFSKDLTLKSITPVDFQYAEQDGQITEDENYKYLTVIAQHSDNDIAQANKVYTPFSLEFELNKYCPLNTVMIEMTDNSVAMGDEDYPLPSANAEITVIPKQAESITISEKAEVDGIHSFTATVLPDYTRNKNVLWSVDDETIATISQYGVLSVLKNGTVTITATTTDGSNLYDSKTIDVIAPSAVESISISQGTQSGNTIQFSADVLPTTALNKNVVWSVNDTSIATISQTGLLTILQNGTVTVTATAEDGFGATANKSVTFTVPATLSALSSSIGVWSGDFSEYKYDYTLFVPKGTSSISFNANWASGTTKCNGNLMIKNRDKEVAISSDNQTVTITRTGVTDRDNSTYTINVVRMDALSLSSPYEIFANQIKFNVDTLITDSKESYSLYAIGYDEAGMITALSKEALEYGNNQTEISLDNANKVSTYKITALSNGYMPLSAYLSDEVK